MRFDQFFKIIFLKLRNIITRDLYKYLLLIETETRGVCVSHEKMDEILLETLREGKECKGK